MKTFLQDPASLAFFPSLPIVTEDLPLLMPALGQLESPQLKSLIFDFPIEVIQNIQILKECTQTLTDLDKILREGQINHTFVRTACSRATFQTFKNPPKNWDNFENKFCRHFYQKGFCQRDLYAEHLRMTEKWLKNLFIILEASNPSRKNHYAPTRIPQKRSHRFAQSQ